MSQPSPANLNHSTAYPAATAVFARQFAAAFLIEDLQIDWRVGADWFEVRRYLLSFFQRGVDLEVLTKQARKQARKEGRS